MSGPNFSSVILGLFRRLGIRVPIGSRNRRHEDAGTIQLGDGFVDDLTERQLRRGDDKLRVGLEMFRRGIAPDREHEIRIARTRWLETNRARASFGCGVAIAETAGAPAAPDPWGEARKDAPPVTVAVTTDEFVFLQEGSAEAGTEPLVEAGRFPRRAFSSVHLEDARGQRVIGPAGDVFEPATPCRLVVTWRDPDGTEHPHVFGFMSLRVAEDAAGRFRRFAGPV